MTRREDALEYVLIVTWFVYGSPPSDYQVPFESEKACDEARLKILREADRLNAELEEKIRQFAKGGIGATYRQPKQVSAICAAIE